MSSEISNTLPVVILKPILQFFGPRCHSRGFLTVQPTRFAPHCTSLHQYTRYGVNEWLPRVANAAAESTFSFSCRTFYVDVLNRVVFHVNTLVLLVPQYIRPAFLYIIFCIIRPVNVSFSVDERTQKMPQYKSCIFNR